MGNHSTVENLPTVEPTVAKVVAPSGVSETPLGVSTTDDNHRDTDGNSSTVDAKREA